MAHVPFFKRVFFSRRILLDFYLRYNVCPGPRSILVTSEKRESIALTGLECYADALITDFKLMFVFFSSFFQT